MKKTVLYVLCFAAGVSVAAAALLVWYGKNGEKTVETAAKVQSSAPVEKKRVLTGYGYIRGRSTTTLRNKYGAFVSKVHFYSDAKVKKGDCIIEYDDFDLRKKIISTRNTLANLKQELQQQQTQLQLTRLDPLPSDYRNINWKIKRAKELLDRTENEWLTYDRLHKSQSVSELDWRSRKQAHQDALAAYQIAVSDQLKVNKGLKELRIVQAEQNVELLKVKIAGVEKELALLEEERKYYKIVTPYDGVIVTNSDTVHAWDNAGTAAACIHRTHRGYYVYSYFEEKDIIHIPNGTAGKFFSNDNGKWYDLRSFDVTKTRTATGDKVFHLVKFRVLSQVGKDITMEGNGTVHVVLN
ncbi:MAG: hypothetical protein IKA87_09285 [Lentisphaeria bacterium]|nr:hypothetical protein [Lentisphaeria bacterium]